jgi:hypothetical protein
MQLHCGVGALGLDERLPEQVRLLDHALSIRSALAGAAKRELVDDACLALIQSQPLAEGCTQAHPDTRAIKMEQQASGAASTGAVCRQAREAQSLQCVP